MTRPDTLWPGAELARYDVVVDADLLGRHASTVGHDVAAGEPLPSTVFAAQPFTLGPRSVPPRWRGALTASYELATEAAPRRGERVSVTTTVTERVEERGREFLTETTTCVGEDGRALCTATVTTFWFLDQMAPA